MANEVAAPFTLPRALQKGDRVSLIAPSGPVNRLAYEQAVHVLESFGLDCVTYRDVTTSSGYLAGSDDDRIRECNAAISDPSTQAVLPIRGGYGLTRILKHIEFSPLLNQPKLVAGFSDITALHCAIQNRVGLATLHAPNLQDGIGSHDFGDAAATHYWQCLFGQGYSAGDQSSINRCLEITLECVHPGSVRAPIVGGNLAVLCGLMGTPWEVDCRGRILLIEDIDEAPYRVDRMLTQLVYSGKLTEAAGVLVGSFTPPEDLRDTQDPYAEVLSTYLGNLDKPVASTTEIGHGAVNLAVPLGATVELDADRGVLRIREHIEKE